MAPKKRFLRLGGLTIGVANSQRIFDNLGVIHGAGQPSNAVKWATAATVEFATPPEPANSAQLTMKISNALMSGGTVSTSCKTEKDAHLSHRREYFAKVDGLTLCFSIRSTLEWSIAVTSSSSVTVPKST
jgi:hypothetical protein